MTKSRLLLLLLLTLPACHKPLADAVTDPARMRDTLLALAPVGTGVDSAMQRLARVGFACTRNHGTFGDHPVADYLYCDASGASQASVSRRWQVAVFLEGDHVADVSAKTGLIGP